MCRDEKKKKLQKEHEYHFKRPACPTYQMYDCKPESERQELSIMLKMIYIINDF